MCPFDNDDDLLSLKPKAISLWHEHQAVLGSLASAQTERDALAAKVKDLEAQVARKNKALFGPTSERSKKEPIAQEATATSADESKGDNKDDNKDEKKKQKWHGRREQPHLQTEAVEHTLQGDELRCDACGGTLELFEGQEETSTEIDVERRR